MTFVVHRIDSIQSDVDTVTLCGEISRSDIFVAEYMGYPVALNEKMQVWEHSGSLKFAFRNCSHATVTQLALEDAATSLVQAGAYPESPAHR